MQKVAAERPEELVRMKRAREAQEAAAFADDVRAQAVRQAGVDCKRASSLSTVWSRPPPWPKGSCASPNSAPAASTGAAAKAAQPRKPEAPARRLRASKRSYLRSKDLTVGMIPPERVLL